MPDYHRQIQRALERQRGADKTKAALDRATARMPASSLTLGDIVDVVSELMAEQRRDLVGHMQRLFQLSQLDKPAADQRNKNIHFRLTNLESEIRSLKRGRPR